MGGEHVTLRLLFVDDGEFYSEEVTLDAPSLKDHDRLIDGLMEDSRVLKQLHVDFSRLVSARIVEG